MLSITNIIVLALLLHNSVVCSFKIASLPRRRVASSNVRNQPSTQSRVSSRSFLQSSIVEGDVETASVTLSGP